MATAPAPIQVSLYDGAYGPTLRIDLQSLAHVELLRAMLRSLRDGAHASVELSAGAAWAFDGLSELVLTTDPRAVAGARAIRAGSEIRVGWRMSIDGWEYCLDLLDGLVADDAPGHQYLTEERKGYLLVVAAFLEPRPAR